MMQLFFGELVTIVVVDILKVGAMDISQSGKKARGQYLRKSDELNGFALQYHHHHVIT